MQITKQLAIFLDNQPGMLAEVCQAMAAININILAISTSDTVDHSVIRMVVDDPAKALEVFEERGTLVVDDEVLMIEASNQPGTLASIAAKLAQAKINIEYCYCTGSSDAKNGLIILRVAKPTQALRALKAFR